MKLKALVLSLLAAAALSAQTTPEATLIPFGAWVACQIPQEPGICPADLSALPRDYMLTVYIDPNERSTYAFAYTITGTVAGVPYSKTDVVLRSTGPYTNVFFEFTAALEDVQITVTPLLPIRNIRGRMLHR